jgi:hypothetical protein
MDLSDHAEGVDAPVIHESQALAAFLSTVNAFLPIAEPDTVSFVLVWLFGAAVHARCALMLWLHVSSAQCFVHAAGCAINS